jgi:two-component system chemotaxis response regulator CheV
LVPVIDLARYAGIQTESRPEIMIVSEYNGHTQGFLVEAVDTILRLDWSVMRVPPDMLTMQMGGLVTAVTELENGKLVMMLDVEKVLAETTQNSNRVDTTTVVQNQKVVNKTVFFADDSLVARSQIEQTLDAMNIRHIHAINGKRAWDELLRIAQAAEIQGMQVKDMIHLVLTDVEMPEMDGYMLTKQIKSDPRFAGIPVLMHSSLSGLSNQKLGQSVGVDGYVAKFEPHKLSQSIANFLLRNESTN